MSNPLFGHDRDGDSDIDFQDLPDEQRRDITDVDGPDADPLEQKLQKAEGLLEAKARRQEEQELDRIIYNEEHPRISALKEKVRGVGEYVGNELKRRDATPAPARRAAPSARGRAGRAAPVDDRPMRRPAPSRQLGDSTPHGIEMSARFTNMNRGMRCFSDGCLGGGGSSRGPSVSVGGDNLSSFSRGLLGMGQPVQVPVQRQEPVYERVVSYKRTPRPAPAPTRAPDLSRVFGINGNMSGVSLGTGGNLTGISLGGLTGKKPSTKKGIKKKSGKGISLIGL
jgi:hypothetical protein